MVDTGSNAGNVNGKSYLSEKLEIERLRIIEFDETS